MKSDLVMWTKNGEKTLPLALSRIDKVIPSEDVNKKILVDDSSKDNTRKIAKEFNWQIHDNPRTGIPSGANEALRHVTTPNFISFEQDVLLAKNWYDTIPSHMDDPKVAAVNGLRVYSCSPLKELTEFLISKESITCSIDNTVYRTEIIRNLGGFPASCPMCSDTILFNMINRYTPFQWLIDASVVSLHLRIGIKDFMAHMERKAKNCTKTKLCMHEPATKVSMARMFCSSPVRGLEMALKKNCPNLAWFYPYVRFSMLKNRIC